MPSFVRPFCFALLTAVLTLAPQARSQTPAQTPETGWPAYGGDAGGTRFSQASQITRENVSQLHPVWTFHTHAVDHYDPATRVLPSFEATPVLSGDTLYLISPYDVVFALDARTGLQRWRYDPVLEHIKPDSITTARGVALWPVVSGADAATPEVGQCSRRVFFGTLDARLLALDASTGRPCEGFGIHGSVDLSQGVYFQNIGFYGVTSPPTVVGNVVVIGSTVGDNQQVDIESGLVRGYDAITGTLLWSWEPLPWAAQQKVRTGAGNVWSVISADPALGLVYLPTGSAAPDIYGGMRPGDNRDADSIVALDAQTGKKVWAFQVVHHDVWDYDIASQPILFTWRGTTPAVAVTTKMGMIFLLDRRTGKPLVPVEERAVPQSDVPGEQLSPNQPFQNIPSLSPLVMDTSGVSPGYQRPPDDVERCRQQFASLRYDGLYTPPSLRGSISFPGNLGGVNWGGAAIDPTTGILYANTNRRASVLQLVPRSRIDDIENTVGRFCDRNPSALVLLVVLLGAADAIRRRSLRPGWVFYAAVLSVVGYVVHDRYIDRRQRIAPPKFVDHFNTELSPQRKTPYLIGRHPLIDSRGLDCTPAPWGAITAVNLNTLTRVWEKPLGTVVPGQETGIINFGGPIVTAAGLVFTGGAEDKWLRVCDAATGELLQKVALPFSAQSTPMTYTLDGRQYVVIAAGGHGDGYVALGDSLVAFSVN